MTAQATTGGSAGAGEQRTPVVVTGANGLVGTALVRFLSGAGRDVRSLVRRPGGSPKQYAWDPQAKAIDEAAHDGVRAVVHLAGENIATGRWSPQAKKRILESRTHGTQFLCEKLARLAKPPAVLVSASAVGFYGDRGSEPLDETSSRGRGFLADVCEQWEQSTTTARDAGIRVVLLRLGVVMTPYGGALAKMLPAFRLGGGAVLGSGEQYVSWIALEDLVRTIAHAIDCDALDGPVNATSPAPVTNAELTRLVAGALGRPAFLRAPAFVLRAALGEMADEMLLASARVMPERLVQSGYEFRHPELGPALADMLREAS